MMSPKVVNTLFVSYILSILFCHATCTSSSTFDEFSFLTDDLYSGEFAIDSNQWSSSKNAHEDAIPINTTEEIVNRWMSKYKIPGVVVGVSVKGKEVWSEGFGFIDIENHVPATPNAHWRLASISKSLTTSLVGKLLEEGKLEWDKPIYNYLKPSVFPVKTWKGKAVNITLRQVMSHTAGLRVTDVPYDYDRIFYDRKNVTQVLDQFKNEPLLSEPGTQFNYSNYGFQVVGAIIESVMSETYESAITKVFKSIGLTETFPEQYQKIYHNKARYYEKNKTSNDVHNCQIWDDLWIQGMWYPAGGIMSTAGDLLKFGNVMINSFKGRSQGGFLKQSTVKQLWTPKIKMDFSKNSQYGKRKVLSINYQPIICHSSS